MKNFVDTAPYEYDNSRDFAVNLKNQLLDKNEEGGRPKHQIQSRKKTTTTSSNYQHSSRYNDQRKTTKQR